MEQYLINDTTLTAIGDAIRQVKGEEKYYESSAVIRSSNINDDGSYKNYNYTERSALEVVCLPGATTLHVHMKYLLGTTYPSLNFMCVWEGAHPEYTAKNNYDTSITGKKYNTVGYTYQYTEFDVPGDTLTFGMCNDYGSPSGGYIITITSDKGGRIEEHFYLPSEIPQQILDIAPVVESIEITDNGTYTPSEGIDGFNEIIVKVPGSLPDEAYNITGICKYKFSYNGWNWLIEDYGSNIKTKDITSTEYMFSDCSTLTKIPFDINIKSGTPVSMTYMFSTCQKLETLPRIINLQPNNINSMFNNCQMLREIPEDWCDTWDWSYMENRTGAYACDRGSSFQACFSLRKFPMEFLAHANPMAYTSYMTYYYLFYCCYTLDEVIDLPIPYTATYTSNIFYQTFNNCYRLKNLTFEINEDGTPKVMNWKNQTIDLSNNIGYSTGSDSYIINYNSGITKDKKVIDDASYQALKDDPDWYAITSSYSRYNHDSAVATINSLPDTTSSGGTNTIKFKGDSGSKTDGGAINTLTAEEIAVAAAKGWTVSIV